MIFFQVTVKNPWKLSRIMVIFFFLKLFIKKLIFKKNIYKETDRNVFYIYIYIITDRYVEW